MDGYTTQQIIEQVNGDVVIVAVRIAYLTILCVRGVGMTTGKGEEVYLTIKKRQRGMVTRILIPPGLKHKYIFLDIPTSLFPYISIGVLEEEDAEDMDSANP